MSTTRTRICDTCLSCPSTVFCKADFAYLCATCDAVIHSANPLAGRHQRVPVIPISGLIYGGDQATDRRFTASTKGESQGEFLSGEPEDAITNEDEDETVSWLLLDNQNENGETNGLLFNGDDYLDLVQYNCCQDDSDNFLQQSYGGSDAADGIVPVQVEKANKPPKLEFGMEYEISNGGYGYSSGQLPALIDRKARVLRYMEKKKRRKFEKTIRYASRKAYAEIRPRIKGRFAKRTNVGVEVEQMFSTIEGARGYFIVPSI